MYIQVRAIGVLARHLASYEKGSHEAEVALEIADGATIHEVLQEVMPPGKTCMVALEGKVILSARWADTRIADGDTVLIMSALRGG